MVKYLAAYATVVVVIAALDLLWLGVIAKSIYQDGIGHLLAARPNFIVAAVFYPVFALGIMVFAVAPDGATNSWSKTIVLAALFGFVAYATYDLTNLATLKNWPVALSLLDMAWGSLLSVVAATAGKAALDRISTG